MDSTKTFRQVQFSRLQFSRFNLVGVADWGPLKGEFGYYIFFGACRNKGNRCESTKDN